MVIENEPLQDIPATDDEAAQVAIIHRKVLEVFGPKTQHLSMMWVKDARSSTGVRAIVASSFEKPETIREALVKFLKALDQGITVKEYEGSEGLS